MDERTLEGENRVAGFLGPQSSSFTLAWLAGHRDRLRTLILGGKRLSVLVVWDRKGTQEVHRTEAEVDAIRTIVYGPAAHRESQLDREES